MSPLPGLVESRGCVASHGWLAMGYRMPPAPRAWGNAPAIIVPLQGTKTFRPHGLVGTGSGHLYESRRIPTYSHLYRKGPE